MKNLDFKKNGLKELSNQEMLEIEGGGPWFKVTGFLGWVFGGNSWDKVEITLFGLEIK